MFSNGLCNESQFIERFIAGPNVCNDILNINTSVGNKLSVSSGLTAVNDMIDVEVS
jgi:hypothetical protein